MQRCSSVLMIGLQPFRLLAAAILPPFRHNADSLHLQGVAALVSTLIVSLPAFWNVGALLFLLFFIYAYIAVLLFGSVKHNEGLDYHANFETFPMALLTLLR